MWQSGACGSAESRHPKAEFSIKVRHLQDLTIGLDKWLMAMWMVANCKNGVSSYEIHRGIKVAKPENRMVYASSDSACHEGRTN